MQTGLQRLIATVLMHSRTIPHNGVTKTMMDSEAILTEIIPTIVQIKLDLRIKMSLVVLTEMETVGQTQETRSQTMEHNGPILMAITTVIISLGTILTHSRTMHLNGVTKTEMVTVTTLVELTETASLPTLSNGLISTMMAMETTLLMKMEMGFQKGVLMSALKPMANHPVQPLEDVLIATVMGTLTLMMHSLLNLFNGKIAMGMVMETTHNSQTVTNALTSLERACTTAVKDVLIQI
jgi:hypothetical protein